MQIEVKMNKEIMEYREAMFFGLDFRQMACSLLAVLAAVGIYFSLREKAGEEVTGWLCMLGAAPFAFCGFFRYHGMTAEQFAWAFIKSEFLYPKRLLFQPEDLYYQCMEERISNGENGKGERNAKKLRREERKKRRKQAAVRKRIKRKQMRKKQAARKGSGREQVNVQAIRKPWSGKEQRNEHMIREQKNQQISRQQEKQERIIRPQESRKRISQQQENQERISRQQENRERISRQQEKQERITRPQESWKQISRPQKIQKQSGRMQAEQGFRMEIQPDRESMNQKPLTGSKRSGKPMNQDPGSQKPLPRNQIQSSQRNGRSGGRQENRTGNPGSQRKRRDAYD